MKKENIIKIVFAGLAFVLLIIIIIMLFFRKGFAGLTNKELICENTIPGYRTKSIIKYKSNKTYEESFDTDKQIGNGPLTSEYTYKTASSKDLKENSYKAMKEVQNGDSYLLTLKERKQRQKDGKILTLDKNVEYIVTVKGKNVQIFSKSRNINKLCKVK